MTRKSLVFAQKNVRLGTGSTVVSVQLGVSLHNEGLSVYNVHRVDRACRAGTRTIPSVSCCLELRNKKWQYLAFPPLTCKTPYGAFCPVSVVSFYNRLLALGRTLDKGESSDGASTRGK